MSDFNSELPVRTSLPGQVNSDDVIIKLGDATNPTTQQASVDTFGSQSSIIKDVSGNAVTTEANGALRALDVMSQSSGPVVPGTAASFSDLIGGQYNSTLPTLTNGQQSAIQVDNRGRLLVSTTTNDDHNYGVVGANTLRTAAQIGNATGAADFNAGATGAQTLRVEANQGAPGLAANGWFTRITDGTNTASVSATGELSVIVSEPLPAGTNNIGSVNQGTSPWIISGTVTANQGTSPWVTSATQSGTWTVGLSEDHNYGTVGANTLRTAAQIGNATGAALFGAGATTAQVLRVVLPTDQTAIPVTQSGIWTTGRTWTLASGTDSVAAVQSGAWSVSVSNFPADADALAQGSTTSGQLGSLTMGAVTTAAPSYTTAQTSPLSLTTAGALRVDGSAVTQPISAASLPLPTGAATSANQATEIASLASIDAGIPAALGQTTMSASMPVVIASNQTAIPVTVTFPYDENWGTVGATTLRTAAEIGNATGAADFNAGATGAQTLRTQANQGAAGASAWLTTDAADGPVTPGTVASKSMLAGGQFNTALPTLTNTQQSSIQLDSSGRLITSPGTDSDKFASGTLGALNATLILATAGCGAALFRVDGTWVGVISAYGTIDGTNWTPLFFGYTGGALNVNLTAINGQYRLVGVPGQAQIKLQMTSYTSGTATVSINASSISNTTQNIQQAPRQTSHFPDPSNISDGTIQPLKIGKYGSLQVRGAVTTDDGSFRDDFSGTSLTNNLTGTMVFTNGNASVIGTGTLFKTEVKKEMYIRKTGDSISDGTGYKIIDILSDFELLLERVYGGTTSSTTATISNWLDWPIPTGGSMAVANSIITMTPGTVSGNRTRIERDADFGPYVACCLMSVSQRIANQNTIFGFYSDSDADATTAMMRFVFDGTDNTKVKCQSASTSAAADIQETIITLPSGITTNSMYLYELDLTIMRATFSINKKVVATHQNHLPGPYDQLEIGIEIINTGTAASNTTLSVDHWVNSNVSRLETTNTFIGDPQKVQLVGADSITGLPTDLKLDSGGNLIVTALTGFGADFSFGDITTSSQNKVVVNRTTYTEQVTNAQRSFASASVNDSAAGTGMQTLILTYFDQTGAGPFTENITLNGTTGVNTVNTNICFIEDIKAITVGSTGSNVGIVTLYAAINKGGAVIGTIGATDNQTFWTHHYVAIGKTCNITGMSCGHNGTTVGSGALFTLNRISINLANAVDLQVNDFVRLYGQSSTFSRSYTSPIKVVGPARLRVWVTPETSSSTTYRAAFDFFES